MKHLFQTCHPAVTLLYLTSAILCGMLTLHPAWVVVSFVVGSLYAIFLAGLKRWLKGLRLLAVLFLLVALGTPLFSHKGATPLFNIGEIPVTMESILYGLCMGGMLLSVFIWFQCYQALMTNDRFLFLFGRVAPTSALMVSMILKFVPVTAQKYGSIKKAQAALGRPEEGGDRKTSIRNSVRMTGILMSWSMEAAIDTADSMRARGYGATKRTHFSNYRLSTLDVFSLVFLGGLLATNLSVIFCYAVKLRFFPFLMGPEVPAAAPALYGVMLLYPLLLEGKERLRWAGR